MITDLMGSLATRAAPTQLLDRPEYLPPLVARNLIAGPLTPSTATVERYNGTLKTVCMSWSGDCNRKECRHRGIRAEIVYRKLLVNVSRSRALILTRHVGNFVCLVG